MIDKVNRKTIYQLFMMVVALLVLAVVSGSSIAVAAEPAVINEVYASHTGTDDTEFVELYGTPGTSLAGYSLIVVESDAFGPGAIDRQIDFLPFHVIGENGFFLIGNCSGLPNNYGVTPNLAVANNFFENSSLTTALVETASISGGLVSGSEVVVDAVGLNDGDSGDTFFFGAPVIGPDGSFFPAGVRRVADGVDTDTAADWVISDFNLGSDNTPTASPSLDGCAPLELTIPEIQGRDQFSIYDGALVTTSGIVTLITDNGRDMWIQDPDGDHDDLTSDGIFVDDRDRLSPMPEVGDYIEITATVEEQQFGTDLPKTRLNNPEAMTIISSGNELPKAVNLAKQWPFGGLPSEQIPQAIEYVWEPLEGMLVSVRRGKVIAPTTRFGEFGMVVPADLSVYSGYSRRMKQFIIYGYNGDGSVDYNPERILVDDATISDPIIVRPGDNVRNFVGVVDYSFGMFKLQPAEYTTITRELPDYPVSRRQGPKGNTAITTYNVANLFDLIDNPDKDDQGSTPSPEDLEIQLTKLALSIEFELRTPAIIVVQEVENTEILGELADRVNAAAGTSYEVYSEETSDGRGIEVGFMWDTDRVSLLNGYQLTDDIVPGVSAAFGPTSPSPGREPLVGVFDIDGNQVTIVGNHFKSKRGDDPLFGVNQPPIRISEVQRKAQARVVRDFVNIILDADPHAMVMVTGDLNDFQFDEPGEGPDHPVAILEGGPGEVPLFPMIDLERPDELFSFVFDANSQVLDHMLVSPALGKIAKSANFLHFNTSYPAVLGADPTTTLHASDHDPLEGRFRFRSNVGFTLTILHNNDGESQLVNAGTGLEDFGGVARFTTLVNDLRDEAVEGSTRRNPKGVVLLSSGDNFLAGPEFIASLEKGVPYYDSTAVRLIGYDAMAIGNHEFDFGPDVLANFIEGIDGAFPFVSANLNFTGEPNLQAFVDSEDIVKSTVIYENGTQIGVVGATTPELPFISGPRNVVVDPDVAGAIQAEIDDLTAAGVDKIVVISHLQGVDEDLALAGALTGVDVMIAGGGDELLANDGDVLVPGDDSPFGPYPLIALGKDGTTIPVVTTPGDYKYVGQLQIIFDKMGRVTAIGDDSGLIRVAGGANPDAVAPDPVIQSLVVDPVQLYLDNLATNVIGTSEVALEGRRNPGVRTEETNEGNLLADALLWQAAQEAAAFGVNVPDVALQNGGGIRNNNLIPAGDITELTTFDIAPFANFVVVVEDIPAEQFKEIMENAVSQVETASGRFAQIAGFTMVYDAAGTAQVLDGDGNVVTAGNRVLEITLDDGTPIVSGGAVVAGAPAINIATANFLAAGGDQYPFRGAPYTSIGTTYQRALFNFIVDELGGLITAADYPEGGEGRITRIN